MAILLVAVLLTLLVSHLLPELARLRNFSWLQHWLSRLNQERKFKPESRFLLALGVPVLICALLQQYVFHSWFYGFSGFIFTVIVLYYCWGPRDLNRDIDAVLKAPDSERRLVAAQALRPEGSSAPLALEPTALVEATFQSALQRWFGVLFWLSVLGPAGSLLYRLTQLMAFSANLENEQHIMQRTLAQRLARVLDWAPSHLMALALALAADFDSVFKTWRDYHKAHRQGYFTLDLGFLGAIAHTSVDADVIAEEGTEDDTHNPLVELEDAATLIDRVLVIWLTVMALIVLSGWVG